MTNASGLRILIVDDERAILRFLRASLQNHGSEVAEASTAADASVLASEFRPDIIILDLGLPDMDGIELTRRLREWTQVPIIILSVRDQETEKIRALDAGADDYLTKPFGVGELLARIRTALRHTAQSEIQPVYEIEDLIMDLEHRKVTIRNKEVSLTPTEYDLLRILVQHTGKVLTHHHLLQQIWGKAYENETHLLRVNISNLRRKIEIDPNQPHYILTEPGVGYRLAYHDLSIKK